MKALEYILMAMFVFLLKKFIFLHTKTTLKLKARDEYLCFYPRRGLICIQD